MRWASAGRNCFRRAHTERAAHRCECEDDWACSVFFFWANAAKHRGHGNGLLPEKECERGRSAGRLLGEPVAAHCAPVRPMAVVRSANVALL